MSRKFFTIFITRLPSDALADFKAQLAEFYKDPNNYTVCTNFSVEIMQFHRSDFAKWTFRCPSLSDAKVDQFRDDLRKAVHDGQDYLAVSFPLEATYMEVD